MTLNPLNFMDAQIIVWQWEELTRDVTDSGSVCRSAIPPCPRNLFQPPGNQLCSGLPKPEMDYSFLYSYMLFKFPATKPWSWVPSIPHRQNNHWTSSV